MIHKKQIKETTEIEIDDVEYRIVTMIREVDDLMVFSETYVYKVFRPYPNMELRFEATDNHQKWVDWVINEFKEKELNE